MASVKADCIPSLDPTEPYWLAEAGEPYRRFTNFRSTPDLPTRSKVVIIGAGLTGISTAYWLIQQGITDVTIVDSRGVSEGATGRNGGHLWAYTEIPTQEEYKRYGHKAIVKRHNFQFDTVRLMIQTILKHKIDCDLKITGAMNIALTEAENESFINYVDQFKKLNLFDKRFVPPFTLQTDTPTGSTQPVVTDEILNDTTNSYVSSEDAQKYSTSPNAKGGIYCKFAGQVWPAKFVFGLADIVTKAGVNLQTRTQVIQVSSIKLSSDSSDKYSKMSFAQGYKVDTNRGSIIADHVVYATNGYTSYLIPELKQTIVPTQGQVICLAPLPINIPGNTWYDYGYLYMIQRPNGRIILGGCRNKNPDGETNCSEDNYINPIVGNELRKFFKSTFPAVADSVVVEHEWTGVMGFTPDTLPLIGRLRGNEWIAAGYTGYGMPKCFGAGKAIAEMIAGKLTNSEFVPQYDPSRYFQQSKL